MFQRRRNLPTRPALLAAIPLRNSAVRETPLSASQTRLTAPLRSTPFTRLFGTRAHEKSFDLDDLGLHIWRACDGRSSIETIITQFAASRRLNLREAEIAVTTFLRTLVQRRLIALAAPALETPITETPITETPPPPPSPPNRLILPTRQGYDRWAKIYDAEGNPLIALEEPLIEELLGPPLTPLRGLTVLDLGCGTGRHALRLAAQGATVHALDFSSAMLENARQKARAAGTAIQFHQHDLAAALPFPTATFDRIICGLVLDHIAGLPALFAEMHRVCRPDGCVIISVMHPAMMLRDVQARFHDPATGQEIRPASQPHQLTDYIRAATGAGFTLDHLSEHAVDEILAAKLPRAQRYLHWPMLFLMRLHP